MSVRGEIWTFAVTFLLSAVHSAAFGVDQTVYASYQYGNTVRAVPTTIEGGGWKTLTIEGAKTPATSSVKLDDSRDWTFVAHPSNGWLAVQWWGGNGSSSSNKDRYWKVALTQPDPDGQPKYVWSVKDTKNDLGTDKARITVCFEPLRYDVQFAPGVTTGSSGKMAKLEDVCYTNVFALPRCEYAREGYSFTGWINSLNQQTLTDAATVSGESLGIRNDSRATTLTAQWSEKSYDIASSGENCTVAVSAATAAYTQQITIAVTPPAEEPGVTFAPGTLSVYAGTEASGTPICQRDLAPSMTFALSKDVAKYYDKIFVMATYVRTENPKHWLTIHPNGGRYKGNPDNQTLATQLVEGGTVLNQLDISVNPNGAEFRGYFDAASDGNPVYDKDGKGVLGLYWNESGQFTGKQNLNVWAYWGDPPDSYEVAFEAPAEAGIVRVDYDGHRSEGTNLVLSVIEGSNFVATAVSTNAGYSFSCWTNSLGMATNDNPWTLAVDGVVTNVAVFTGNVYKVKFNMMDCDWNEYEGTVKPASKSVTYGQPYGELPVPTLDDKSLRFESWVDENGAEVCAESRVLITRRADLYLKVSRKESYTLKYDGNGGTGEMESETAYRDTPHDLKPNGFAKTGYTFANWTNAAGVAYADGATVTNLAAAGETATLYAVWSNNVYSVDFDGNDATGGAMEPQAFTYDVAAKLSANGFTKAGMEFAGWSTNGVTDVVYTNGEEVLNLCTGAAGDERVMLKAVWDVGDYSRAMHCMTLKWEPEITPFTLGSCWSIEKGTDVGYDRSGSDVRVSTRSPDAEYVVSYIGETDCLAAEVPSAGTLTFRCFTRTSNSSTELQLLQRMKGETWTTKSSWTLDELASGDWYDPISVDIPQTCEIGFRVNDNRGSKELIIVQIDQVTWIPAGAEPLQGDPVSATAVSVTEGKFTLSVPGDSGVNYGVWTNANLLVPVESWGFMTNHVGEGSSFSFELPIAPELPQLFFSTFKVK